MPEKISCELDPLYETLVLLYHSHHVDELKPAIVSKLSELGIDGEQFYSANMQIYENYLMTFIKYRVAGPKDELFFASSDDSFFNILLTLLISGKGSIPKIGELTDEQIIGELIQICMYIFEYGPGPENILDIDQIISFLAGLDMDERSKWRLLRIMQAPKEHIIQLLDTINANIDAYKKAEAAVSKPLKRLIESFTEDISSDTDDIFHRLKSNLTADAVIYPSLAYPLALMISDTDCHYGLLVHKINSGGNPVSREYLLTRLKALADKSKLEILSSLKNGPKFNLEIARELNLTAATMSYHMNVLLASGFVGLEKRDGKVYYHLAQDSIKALLEDIKKAFL